MKILLVLERFPYPPDSGQSSYGFNLLKAINKYHLCDLIYFTENIENQYEEKLMKIYPNLAIIKSFKKNSGTVLKIKQIFSLLKGDLPSTVRFENNYLRHYLVDLLNIKKYDLVHFNLFNIAFYRPCVKDTPVILDSIDAYSKSLKSTYLNSNYSFLKRINSYFLYSRALKYEKKWYAKYNSVQVVSETDAKYYKDLNNKISINVLPLAVERKYFSKNSSHIQEGISIFCTAELNHIHLSRLLIEYLNRFWLKFIKEYPSNQMIVHTKQKDGKLLKMINALPNLKVVNWVTDYSQLLKKSNVILCLDKGGEVGIKTRVIQALASGSVVIGTRYAFNGINVTNYKHCLTCDNSDEIHRELKKISNNKHVYEKLAINAREIIRRRYNEKRVGKLWNNLYKRVVKESMNTNEGKRKCNL